MISPAKLITVVRSRESSLEMVFTGLDSEKALIAAFEQDRGNFSWWNYPPADHYPLRIKDGLLSLGEFSVAEVR